MSKIQDFDFSVNVLAALLWQHNNAKNLEALMTLKEAWYTRNQSNFWESWIHDVFDLRTANLFGCRVWAEILGTKLQIELDPSLRTKPMFGFGAEGGVTPTNTYLNFEHGNFGALSSTSIGLTLEQQRTLLRLRYFTLISRCTVPEINRILADVFADEGSAYVLDSNDMSYIVYVFAFNPSSQLAFLLQNFDLLPRPATVGVKYNVINRPVFGFGPDEPVNTNNNRNFNNATFVTDPVII